MVHGAADYSIYAPKATVSVLADMAELAARLNSIVTYDRKGDVIFMDDYEAPLEKFGDQSSPGAEAKLDSEVAMSGAQSLKLTTPATDDTWAEVFYIIPPYRLGRHGIKVSISPYELDASVGFYQILGQYYDGANYHEFGLRINPQEAKVQVYTPTGYEDCITDLFIDVDLETFWHNVKLTFNLDTGYYDTLLIDALSYDLSAYQYKKTESPVVTVFTLFFTLWAKADNILTCWQEDLVYTINEP